MSPDTEVANRDRPSGIRGYWAVVQSFSPNAKLLLARNLVGTFSGSIWGLIFNIYLLSLGFDKAFVALMLSYDWFAHGALVIPAGILSDLFGRRKTYLIAFFINMLIALAMLFTVESSWLLLLSALSGASAGFHAVTGRPFMLEVTKPEERMHLFTLSGSLMNITGAEGRIIAGVLPLLLAGPLGVDSIAPEPLRWALFCAVPLRFLGLLPTYLIRERWQRQDVRMWVTNLRSHSVLAKLAVTSCLGGLAAGLTWPFFNIFFFDRFGAEPFEFGLVFAAAGVVTSFTPLLAPFFVEKIGRLNTIVLPAILALPFLIALPLASTFLVAGLFYILRGVVESVSGPIQGLFTMELVEQQERGTVEGVLHAANEFPMGLTAGIAGSMMLGGEWAMQFGWAAGLMFVSSVLFLLFFHGVAKQRETPPIERGRQ